MNNIIDLNKLSRDFSKEPWDCGEEPILYDFEYLYLELNLPAKKICEFMGIKSSALSRVLRGLGIYKSIEKIKEVRKECFTETFGSPSPFGDTKIYSKGREKCLKTYGPHGPTGVHMENMSDLTESFWRSSFLKGKVFDAKECALYHNITLATVRKYKRLFNITESNKPFYGAEKEIAEFISSLGVSFEMHNRTILDGQELDIYIPETQLAIEHDGLFFHSVGTPIFGELREDDGGSSQLTKVNKCRAKGIELFKIFEDEWINPHARNVWKHAIKKQLGFARKLKGAISIAEISPEIADDFYLKNNLLYLTVPDILIGVFHGSTLAAVATIWDYNENILVIQDFAELLGYDCSEDILEVISYLENKYNKECQISTDRRKVDVTLMRILFSNGYTLIGGAAPFKHYFNKHKLTRIHSEWLSDADMKALPGYREGRTDDEIMKASGYMTIYDSGRDLFGRKGN